MEKKNAPTSFSGIVSSFWSELNLLNMLQDLFVELYSLLKNLWKNPFAVFFFQGQVKKK